jgi:hypothetical protein
MTRSREAIVQIKRLRFRSRDIVIRRLVIELDLNHRQRDALRMTAITDQVDTWVSRYDERAFLEFDPRVELASEPGYAFWEGRQFDKNPRYKMFLRESGENGVQSGLVIGLCTRDPPSYAMLSFNRASPTLQRWTAEQRLLIAGQAR